MSQSCALCRVYERGIFPYEDDHFYIRFDVHPVTAGHALIVPCRHIESFFQLSAEEWQQLQDTLTEAKDIIEQEDLRGRYKSIVNDPPTQHAEKFAKDILSKKNWEQDPTGYNIGVNEGRDAGRTVDHAHIHLIPRYQDDTSNPVGGVRNIIPGKGDYTV